MKVFRREKNVEHCSYILDVERPFSLVDVMAVGRCGKVATLSQQKRKLDLLKLKRSP